MSNDHHIPNRERTPIRMMSLGVAVWSILFALLVLKYGDRVTSKQWQYLMDFPGGRYAYFGLFGIAGLLGIVGWLKHQYSLKATGLAMTGVGCFGIAVFYLLAPAFIEELFTLGWLIWVLGAGVALYLGVINSRNRKW